MNVRLILASGSPRRSGLLEEAQFNFSVVIPREGAEHNQTAGRNAAELVAELAAAKASDVSDQLREQPGEAVLLAADTVAECAGKILGKPRDETHAGEILHALSGREHQVLTGVCLIRLSNGTALRQHTEVVSTRLQMAELTSDWLAEYLASGRWKGKAGAFGYQEGLDFVRITTGSESNVVGLPMERVIPLLADFGSFPLNQRRG